MGAELELGILGPLEARIDGVPGRLGGQRQRALLAILALHPNQVVSVDRLVDDLWGETPPAKAIHTVHVFISRLRSGLATSSGRLITRPPGYVLELRADELDADRFEHLYSAARTALVAGDPAGASTLLRAAEALWRGPPLADFTYEPFAQATIARLEELRVGAREELLEAQLALGLHDQVVSDLEALVREHPFRERPRGQLMLALYRSGRQAQALEVFREARRAMVEELAVEPGEMLRELEQAILRQDPGLDAPSATPDTGEMSATALVSVEDRDEASDPSSVHAGRRAALVRKTVTVLVARLSSERHTDPETDRASLRLARDRAEDIITRHGGAFVAGLGGELAWVFGLPLVREDDALRALRSADQLRTALASGAPEDRARPTVRIGIDTGEVIAESATDLFGDPVTRAAALAHAASPGDILLGDPTRRFSFNAISVEPAADGAAWRLLDFTDRQRFPVRVDTPMVGREDELEHAVLAFDRVRQTQRANLLTVVGEAGIGKSRLVQELGRRLGDEATFVTGRCLSYGEGIAYWPLREALTEAAGEHSREGIRRMLDGADDAEVVADIVAAAVGLSPGESVGEQLPWAVRRVLEAMARSRPLVLVVDDVHWADPPMLDLVEYLLDWLQAPVLVVCLGRPELLDTRANWGGGHARVSSIFVGPLNDTAALRLLDHQLGHRQLSSGQRDQILRTAEGNPLFVEQYLQLSAEDPAWDRESDVPGAIHSLLSARLDRLGPGERAFIERAAIIGREFWPGAVRELLPKEARTAAYKHLHALVRRGLIHPDRSTLAGEEQLRFHHMLIRDVAYRSTAKAVRGELHERFAEWLDARGEAYDEFVGYHLGRAFRYRREVEGVDAEALAVAERAVDRLSAAGRRALSRGDLNAAVDLLRGSIDLVDLSNQRRPDVLLDLGSALSESGDFAHAERVLLDALKQAPLKADALRARAEVELSYWRSRADPTAHVEEILSVAEQAIDIFAKAGDDGGLARAWFHTAWAHWIRSRGAEMEPALERALFYAERAGEHRERSRALIYLARSFVYGPRPITDVIPRCDGILERAAGDVAATAFISAMFAVVEAMDGRFGDARERWRISKQRLVDLGLGHTVAVIQMAYGFVELLASRPEMAEPELVDACDVFERAGDQGRLSSAAAILARLLYMEGRYDDADRYCRTAETAASEDDVEPQVFWRGVRAKILAHAGQARRAAALSDTAVELALQTDFVLHHGAALSDRAEVMTLLGQPDRAAQDMETAVAAYRRKGIHASVPGIRQRLRELRPDPVAAATETRPS